MIQKVKILNGEQRWRQSNFQTTKDEWLVRKIDDRNYEFIYFVPYKGKGYHQYGGEITHFTVDLTKISNETIIQAIAPEGLTLEDEETTDEVIAQCICEDNLWSRIDGMDFKEYWSDTIEGLNEILDKINVDLKAELENQHGIKRIVFV